MAEIDYIERRLETLSNRLHDAWNRIVASETLMKTNAATIVDLEKRLRALEIEDWKAKGAVALLGFIGAAGGTALVEYIVRHLT